LGKRIFEARTKAGLSQAALATACRVDRQTVYRWEAADREPSATALGALATALGVTADSLLGVAR
jgi:transcriptional regulator with XRE-family HTH domain